MGSTEKAFVGCFLIALGIAGLLMSLCGGFFTIGLLPDALSGHNSEGSGYATGGLVIAVPSLLIGVLFAWLAYHGLTGLNSNQAGTAEPPQTPPSADTPPVDSAQGDDQSKEQ
jgi:hypothetical protein